MAPGARVLDAGCGTGRNLVYLAACGLPVVGVDLDDERLAEARARFAGQPGVRFERGDLGDLPFDDASFDVVLCNAVLHFAPSPDDAARWLDECWRVLAPGGLLWTRLATSIGLEGRTMPLADRPGWHLLPDGSERLLHDASELLAHTRRLGAELVDPIKTTDVQGLRAMTTWVLAKPG